MNHHPVRSSPDLPATISARAADEFVVQAATDGYGYVAAPVIGRPDAAAAGALTILAHAGGHGPPGSRIRQEEVAAQYGASRIPVRGALRILESQGLVEIVANSGAWVTRFSLAECEEMYQMRERIEPLLLRYSMAALSPETIQKILSLTGTMEAARDADAFLQLDRDFHFLTYSGASTITLASTVEQLWNSTQLYRRAFSFLLDEPSMAIAHDEHRMLARALQAGDGD